MYKFESVPQVACGWAVVCLVFTQQWNYVSFVSKKKKRKGDWALPPGVCPLAKQSLGLEIMLVFVALEVEKRHSLLYLVWLSK